MVYNSAMLQGITIFCFAASYAVALVLEALRLVWPDAASAGSRRVRDLVLYGFAGAGLLAHTVFLGYRGLSFQGPSSLLFLSWILAMFYLYGSVHHRRQAWGIFVLPVVLGLVVIAWWMPEPAESASAAPTLWVWLHVALLVLGAVGLCVGFVASVMYLVQSWRLKHKVGPSEGLQLMSLERLEAMNRRGISWAFPLFTGGLLIGIALLVQTEQLEWSDPKVVATVMLWLVFAVLLYLRYGLHERGRRVALWTIGAFGFLVLAFVVQFFSHHLGFPSSHHFGGGP